MKGFQVIYEVARADFLQRIKQKSTLIAIAFMMYFSYLAVPDIKATYYNTVFGMENNVAYRGIYNSAWIGFLVTFIVVTYMTLIGFFLTKNTISRDKQTKVGQVIAASDVKDVNYLFGKVLSNFIYLAIMVGIFMLVAIFLQLTRGESTELDLWKLISPFIFIAIPAMFITGVLSVIFDSTPSLQKTGGNILYFFLWCGIVALSVLGTIGKLIPLEFVRNIFSQISRYIDVFGIGKLSASMLNGILENYPNFNGGFTLGSGVGITEINTFKWDGIEWSTAILLPRLLWILLTVVLFIYASSKFKKEYLIDKVISIRKPIKIRKSKKKTKNDLEVNSGSKSRSLAYYATNDITEDRFSFLDMIIEELNLMLKGVSPWWFLIQGVLILNIVPVPNDVAMSSIIPATFIAPLLVWSKAGTLDNKYGTEQYLFSCKHYRIDQFVALWISVAIFTLLISVSTIIKILVSVGFVNVLALLVGIAFISSLAVFLGMVSGNTILFELIYMALWYLGPLNKIPVFDFLGFTKESISMGTPIIYALISVILIFIALLSRIKKVEKKFN
ncbi:MULTISPECIES: hypothetical protein [Clostridium]|uniref:ABC-2 family transporter protein n=1 Tax=Clostridium cibarium TaxID=2762247 RepID=A0ABR8PTR5_9CLOT|nr:MULTISPECIES: hypothetical protein [Clostridium]MBD7911570.1 hypothetical protein [Clostridium cibarium]